MIKRVAALFLAASVLAGSSLALPEEEGRKVSIDELKKHAPTVFLDCWRCDKDFIRTEITFVNYVRAREDADLHILITEQRTGSLGHEYTMEFIGQKRFDGFDNSVTYTTLSMDTHDEVREKMVEALKKGLFPFLMKTPLAAHLSVVFQEKLKPMSVVDPWNFWVFHLGASGRLSGEKSREYRSIRGNFSATRITPIWKIRMGVSGNFDESVFDYEGDSIVSRSDRQNASGLVVRSISDHWSVGGWTGWAHNTYNNQESVLYMAPAVEYNLFPYDESTRRQLRFLYRLGLTHAQYIEETIYEKTEESLFRQSLAVILAIREPWGNASTSLEGSHYFHDFSKNRLQLNGHLSFRLVRGLSLSIHGHYSRIHDQLGLRKGDASLDEILLRRKELATDFDYSLSLGLSYTFGSVFSNVVNPRFGR